MKKLFEARAEKLFFYSPYNFIRNLKKEKQLQFVEKGLEDYLNNTGSKKYFKHLINGDEFIFCYEHLTWDSNYFGLNTHKLYSVLFDSSDFIKLKSAIKVFIDFLQSNENSDYCFIEIPSEDIILIQALTGERFQLTETRLTYFHPELKRYEFDKRYPVREAKNEDIENLKQVAAVMRNEYDRFHADQTFSLETADRFLATYVEQAVKGFCDIVMVPAVDTTSPPDAFLTANFMKKNWGELGINISKMVLSAVLSDTRSGWYAKLISEMTYRLREEGAQYIFMNTQSTNKAVFKTWERLGYTLGCTTHILSISK